MSKIIFISHDPLTDTIKRNNFLDKFLRDGIEIEYWCVRNIVKYAKGISLNNEIDAPYYYEITSLVSLKEMLAERATGAWIGVEIWFNQDTAKIFLLLKPYAARMFAIDWYCNMPAISVKKKLINDVLGFNVLKLYKIAVRTLNRKAFGLYARLKKIAPPVLLFMPGRRDAHDANRRIVSLNHHDFDVFQANEQAGVSYTVRGRYAVFLDIMLPYHPDFKRLGSGVLDAGTYYKKLNAFFEQLERESGLRVIIAAHPKSDYKQEFNGREVIRGKTSELVTGSEVVLTHHSVSLFYAILNRKKLVLITMDDFEKASAKSFALQSIHLLIEVYAELLQCSVINIDHPGKLELRDVDNSRYEQFEKKFIKGDADKPNYVVIRETLGV
jgi:hypothetical protein